MASIQNLLSSSSQDGSVEPGAIGSKQPIENGSTATETTRFIIEFILDLVCPYCYITLKNLDTAITLYRAKHPEAVIEVVCTPFLLDPLAARSVYDKASYLQERSLQRQGHSGEHLASLAAEAGVEFDWTGRTGNTRDAHKLLRFALEPAPTAVRSTAFATGGPRAPDPVPVSPSPSSGAPAPPPLARGPALQLRLLAALFAAHHSGGADISSRDFLASLGASIFRTTTTTTTNSNSNSNEISADDLRVSVLESAAWDAAVEALAAEARWRRGRGAAAAIGAVPTLVVNDRYVIGGAQGAGFLAVELERIRAAGHGHGHGRGQQGQG